MLKTKKYNYQGFTLVELMVAVAVFAILMSMVVPGFQAMMKNSQVRNASEAILNGMQKARGEAISRNRNIEFILGTNTSWTVALAAGGANIETRNSIEGSADVTRVTVPSTATKVTFNGLGNVVANSDASATLTRVTLSATGANRSLRVDITAGGKAKMCDPNLTAGSSPRACS